MEWVYCLIPVAWTAMAVAVGYWVGRHEIRVRIRPRKRSYDE